MTGISTRIIIVVARIDQTFMSRYSFSAYTEYPIKKLDNIEPIVMAPMISKDLSPSIFPMIAPLIEPVPWRGKKTNKIKPIK